MVQLQLVLIRRSFDVNFVFLFISIFCVCARATRLNCDIVICQLALRVLEKMINRDLDISTFSLFSTNAVLSY